MTRKIPVFATLVVLAAVATMIALGIWQLGRADEKEAMIAQYESALAMSSPIAWPANPADYEAAHYRRSVLDCESVLDIRGTAGRSVQGVQGISQIALCQRDGANQEGAGEVEIALGWSRQPILADWSGGEVRGLIVPAGDMLRLIAMPPVVGLEPLASPDPADLPNNHLAYAGQWFFFALTALVIYILALRRRWR